MLHLFSSWWTPKRHMKMMTKSQRWIQLYNQQMEGFKFSNSGHRCKLWRIGNPEVDTTWRWPICVSCFLGLFGARNPERWAKRGCVIYIWILSNIYLFWLFQNKIEAHSVYLQRLQSRASISICLAFSSENERCACEKVRSTVRAERFIFSCSSAYCI